MKAPNTKPKGRRKRRRRVHRGRLLLVCSAAAVIIISAMTLLSRSCGSGWSFLRGGGDFRRPVEAAIVRGRADAMKAIEAPAGSMERQKALLGIRALEHRLRRAGHDHAADDYLNAATDLLRTRGALSTDTLPQP